MARQMRGNGGARQVALAFQVDAVNEHLFGSGQQRNGVMDCPGALTRAIPGHHDATANHRNVSGVGNNQHWPAGSQNDLFLYFCLYRGLVRVCLTDDHEVCVLCGEHNTVGGARSEVHTSELQSLMSHSSAVFCLKTKSIKPLIKS